MVLYSRQLRWVEADDEVNIFRVSIFFLKLDLEDEYEGETNTVSERR